MKTFLIINEQHTLLEEQQKILEDCFKNWQTVLVPSSGWGKKEREKIMHSLSGTVVFASPVPSMINSLSFSAGENACAEDCSLESPFAKGGGYSVEAVLVFTNDHREKKELPNGKIISITASTGWYLE